MDITHTIIHSVWVHWFDYSPWSHLHKLKMTAWLCRTHASWWTRSQFMWPPPSLVQHKHWNRESHGWRHFHCLYICLYANDVLITASSRCFMQLFETEIRDLRKNRHFWLTWICLLNASFALCRQKHCCYHYKILGLKNELMSYHQQPLLPQCFKKMLKHMLF